VVRSLQIRSVTAIVNCTWRGTVCKENVSTQALCEHFAGHGCCDTALLPFVKEIV